MKTTKIISCNDVTKAHLLKGRLENEGVYCFISNENFATILPIYNSQMGGGVHLNIREEDIEKATQILKEEIEPLGLQIQCPVCDSEDIQAEKGWRGLKSMLIVLFSLLVMIPAGRLKKYWECNDCGLSFRA